MMIEKKYYITVMRSSEEELNDPMVYIDEHDENTALSRTVRIYKNGETTCATWESGYKGEWFESVKFDEDLIKQMKEDKNYAFFKISKEDFDREWERITSEPEFKLKPYSEYTRQDYESRNPAVKETNKAYCPVCGSNQGFEEGDYAICSKCGWENDPSQYANWDLAGGANKLSLNQARQEYNAKN
jgi:hypothetical protein